MSSPPRTIQLKSLNEPVTNDGAQQSGSSGRNNVTIKRGETGQYFMNRVEVKRLRQLKVEIEVRSVWDLIRIDGSQCDQMAGLCVQYLTISNDENVPIG